MYQLFEKYFPNVVQLKQEFLQSTWETLYMVFWTALIAGVLGVLLGVVLVSTGPSGVLKNPPLYSVLEKIINVCRSIPFIIMLALIQPLTRILAGTTIGTTAALVPLVIGVIPFFARQIENALLEVDPGVIEAAEAMGTSPLGIIFRVYLIEGLPSIIRVSAVTIINLINSHGRSDWSRWSGQLSDYSRIQSVSNRCDIYGHVNYFNYGIYQSSH